MKRRQFLQYFSATVIGPSVLSACSSDDSGNNSGNGMGNMNGMMQPSRSASLNYIKNQSLVIPPLYAGDDNNGVQEYNLTLKASSHILVEGATTQTWSINPPDQTLAMLGPTLRLTNNRPVKIHYTNQLHEKTTMHGHGMHVPAAMDGGPHQIIDPNSSWTADYTVKQKASTNWYHPHAMGTTAEQVYKGLAGMIIVEDDESATNGLPNTYGVDDLPIVLQDRIMDGNAQFSYTPTRREQMWGFRGDIWLCNGQIEPDFNAKAGLLRLRLLNGSNAGIYKLSLSDGSNFFLVGTDGALLQSPVELSQIRLSPGERAEIVLNLTNKGGQSLSLQAQEEVTEKSQTFLNIHVLNEVADKTAVPTALTTLNLPSASNAVRTRSFTLDMAGMGQFSINGKSMDLNTINETVSLNQLEIWEITNQMRMPHNFHMHGIHFIPIERNGSAANLEAWERNCYKDTIFLAANDRVKVLVKMEDYTDRNNPYMYHCHILEHEDAGMMGQFIVT